MKDMVLILAVAMCIGAHGADVTIPSTYDSATDTWVGDVDALTNALKTCSAGDTISLSKGVYDISFMTNSPMSTSGRTASSRR